jgi:hypothetical protein
MLLTVHLVERVRLRDGMPIELGATPKGQQRCGQRKQQFEAVHQALDLDIPTALELADAASCT